MSKKDWKKQLFRVKQLADQNLGRAARSEVLSDDLQRLEKRVEVVRQVCHGTIKKLQACATSAGDGGFEKRVKKLPEYCLFQNMIESANLLGTETVMGQLFQLCGDAQGTLAHELLQYEMQLEGQVINPVQGILDNEIPSIQKLRKQLARLILDMDSARSRYQATVRQTHQGSASLTTAKIDGIRDELDEASYRVQQCRDQLATEMYNFNAKEAEHSEIMIHMVSAQVDYHRKALALLEDVLPKMHEQLKSQAHGPVFGLSLETHLTRSNREIAYVLEECICTLLHIGMEEEGLFRIAGAASKLKKLKAAFDYGLVDMAEYVGDIPVVAGVMKQYLRELPEPLLTFELYDEWMQVAYMPADQRVAAFLIVMAKLPKPNYNNLRYLIKFLAKLAEKSDANKMTPGNLAIVIGPNLIWSIEDMGASVLHASTQSAIVEMMIDNAEQLFPGEEDFLGGSSSPQSTPPSTLRGTPPDLTQSEPAPPPPVITVSGDTFLTPPCAPLAADSELGGSPRAQRRANKKPAPLPPQSAAERRCVPEPVSPVTPALPHAGGDKAEETPQAAAAAAAAAATAATAATATAAAAATAHKSLDREKSAGETNDGFMSVNLDDAETGKPERPTERPERPLAPPCLEKPTSPRPSLSALRHSDIPSSPRPERPRGPPPGRPMPPTHPSRTPNAEPVAAPVAGSKPPRPLPPPRLSSRDAPRPASSSDKPPVEQQKSIENTQM